MKKKSFDHYVLINNRKYHYYLAFVSSKVAYFKCEAARIDQEFLIEDIPALLVDLPELILAEKRYKANQKEIVRFRVSAEEKKIIAKSANAKGFKTVSAFLRNLALKG